MFLYFRENVGKIRVFSIKVALATMCAGKLMDKLRCKYLYYDKLMYLKMYLCFLSVEKK